MHNDIPFTQYMLPNGEPRLVYFENDDAELRAKAADLERRGIKLSVEILRTGEVCFWAGQRPAVCVNDERVVDAVKQLIERAALHGDLDNEP